MLLEFKGMRPNVEKAAFIADNCTIAGDVTVGRGSSVWFYAVIRAEVAPITIGALSNVQDHCMVHADYDCPVRIGDLSAVVTGLILALNLPSGAPWWLAVVGSAFAIVIVKGLFGGLGDNFINPALAARALLLASWPKFMTAWTMPGPDAVSTATPLVNGGSYTTIQLFLGQIPGSIGEVCKVAILIGFAWLLFTKAISWRIPVTMVASAFLFSWIFGGDPVATVLSGGLLFGAVFMATDYVTCPMSSLGQLIYAACAGLLVVVIRNWGRYPEGVTYAILLMNAASPLLDHFIRRRVYGHDKEAKT